MCSVSSCTFRKLGKVECTYFSRILVKCVDIVTKSLYKIVAKIASGSKTNNYALVCGHFLFTVSICLLKENLMTECCEYEL